MSEPGGEGRSRVLAALLLAAALAATAAALWVPREQVPLFYDALGYAAQGYGLAHGQGSNMLIGGEALPAFYPAGMSFLGAAVHAVLGPDLRNGIYAVFACALVAIALTFLITRRLLDPWAAATAALLVLASPLFRSSARNIHSQAPSAAVFALCLLLFVRAAGWRTAALIGLAAMLSGVLRFANLALPAGLFVAEVLFGRARGEARRPCLLGLSAGLAVGASCLLAHNVWAFGGPFLTGYDRWGQAMEASFSLTYVLSPPVYPTAPDGTEWGWPLLSTFAGLGRLYTLPVFLAALIGAVVLWTRRRAQPAAGLLVGAVVAILAWQYGVLAVYIFRADTHLVPTLVLLAPLAAVGASIWGGTQWRAVVLLGAALLLLSSSTRDAPRTARERQAVDRYDALLDADASLADDVALVTAGDPPMVDPLFRAGTGRRVLFVGPFDGHMIGEIAARELDGYRLGGAAPDEDVRRISDWVAARLGEGREVYLDILGPSRQIEDLHRVLKRSLLKRFGSEETEVPHLLRLSARS